LSPQLPAAQGRRVRLEEVAPGRFAVMVCAATIGARLTCPEALTGELTGADWL
jgi:hypothetical protein